MTDLTPTLRTALTKALDRDLNLPDADLTTAERDALTALRDACPAPPRQPDHDGIWERQHQDGDWGLLYVIDGRVYTYRCDDGTGWGPGTPLTASWVTEAEWRPVVSVPEPTGEQAREICDRLSSVGSVGQLSLRHILDKYREVMGR